MDDQFVRSFRFKNVLYSLISILLSLATVFLFLFMVYMIYHAITPEKTQTVYIEETSNSSAITNKELAENLSNNYSGGIEKEVPPDTGLKNYPTEKLSWSNDLSTGFLTVIVLLALCIGILSFALYFSLFTRKFSRYLQEIASGIDELSTGNFNVSIPLRSDDELTEIAMNLNRMARDIKMIMETERSTENKKNELITNVAHDLRTPLTSIIGYLDIVSNQKLADDVREKYISIAYSKSQRLEKLIEDLFTYTKFEFGEVKLHRIQLDVVKMMEQLLEEFYPSFCDAGLEYSFHTDSQSAVLEADGDLLARAFANLIGNAVKYGADGKKINVEIKQSESVVTASITNYGEIIPKKDLNRIFEKFYRVDASRNEEHGGTGLGLAIAKNIVEMHKGKIDVRSDLNGTVFEVELPKNILKDKVAAVN